MRLYSGSSTQFITDTMQNQIAGKLYDAFFDYYRYYPSDNEKRAWQNSLRALKDVFQYTGLNDHGVILESQLPLTSKRLDCIICGQSQTNTDHAVIIELKQWEKCGISDGDNEVSTYVGGGVRDVLHPSAQAGQYKLYLEDTHTAFYDAQDPVVLHACSYLHNYNYHASDPLLDLKFSNLLLNYPLFTADDLGKFSCYLDERLRTGNGLEVLRKIEESKFRPSKKLMDHIGCMIKGKSDYILLDEQKVVYDKVFSIVKKGYHNRQKQVLIIKGGPGTGKSVIALNLMADLLLEGYNAHYATGSKAFTETLWEIIGKRGSVQFKYFNSYSFAELNSIDVLICDEAHRIRETSNSRFTPRANKSSLHQIEEILNAAKVCVFFIDDNQTVRPNEIGSVSHIRQFSEARRAAIYENELEAQFRCNGSDAFVNWANNTLGIRRTANVIWDQKEEFDFRIFGDVHELDRAIADKANQGFTARMTAGFCWKWSDPDKDGKLADDVAIGSYRKPWNAKPGAKKLSKSIPPASIWAYDPNGIHQVGCIYTAQGFEFDYVGVIFGKDLVYRFDSGWTGDPSQSEDTIVKRSKDQFLNLVKNVYRVLLTRGMKGCYVYFMDKETENYFRSRIEKY